MNKYKVFANAKINLGLNVYGKDSDNYHKLDTIMLPVDLKDELEIIIFNEEGFLNIECSDKNIPTDKKNILYKTYELFFDKLKKSSLKINVFLKKNIPSEAGLGGGSSDAATFLKILNKYYENYFDIESLKKIAFEIGSDVPFFIENKVARVSGKGETIKEIESKFESTLLLIKPDFGISTKIAYDNFDKLKNIKYSNLDNIEKGLIENNLLLIKENIENGLEQAIENDQKLKLLKNSLKTILPNKKFYMTGSGSVFYTFISKNERDFVETRLKTFLDNVKIFICNIQN